MVTARLELNTQRALPSSGQGPMKVIYDFRNVDWHDLRKDLMKAPLLQAIQGTQDVECALAVWETIVTETLRRHIPIRQIQEKRNRKPWMTSELYRLTKTKFRLFKKARSSRLPADWSKYTRFRNHCTSQVRSAKALYVQRKHEEISSAADGSHHWWTLAKKLAKISTPRATIPDLHTNETVATNDDDKANLLANFFAQQCTATTTNEDLPGAPLPLPPNQAVYDFPSISELTVLRTLQHLPGNKSTAHPLLTNLVLKECAPFLTPSVSYIFNLSVTTGVFPAVWKQATVIPLFKNRGKAEDPSNYRPVSLLPALGKALDKIQSQRLLKHLVEQQLISPHQFGFIPGKSTTMQLLHLTEKWFRALEQGKNVTAVFLDFQKAFDKVWHHGLLHQLTALGISPRSLTWLTSYLSDRSITVRVGSTCSERKTISSGVPQGSHLGPVLFIIFINSLTHAVCIPTDIYADDTTLHHEHSPRAPDCPSYQELQEAINCTEDWAESWHGKFGHAKTRILSTSQDQLLQALTPTINGQPIKIADSHRHLGVILSSNLKWSSHACNVLQTAAKRAGLLRVMSNDLPLPVATRLYIYYVRPTMEYASAVWHGSLREDNAMSMERIQASVARRLLRADWFTPKEKLIEQLGWPALRWRREISSLTLFHKLLHSRPEPLREWLFPFAQTTSSRHRRKPLQLLLPQARTNRYRESFFYRSALLWNSLPHDIQAHTNSTTFRTAIEQHWTAYRYTTTQNIPVPLSSALT